MSSPPSAPRPVEIGDVTIPRPLVLAPMAGICDRHFRLLVRRIGGVGLVSMEFISSEAVTRGIKPELDKMHFQEEERPLAIQIYGRDAERMADCAELVNELRPDICDINMGCPANKVLKGCAGASLMGDLGRAARIIEACRKRLDIPLTVKFRTGLGKGPMPRNYLELGRICQDLDVAAVALHGRTAKQMYSGQADWETIAELKRTVSIPVIGNGDVKSPAGALEIMSRTGCDAAMIGRGVLTDPWIFRKAEDLMLGRTPREPTLEERRSLILTHFSWIERDFDDRTALHKLRTFTGRYTHGMPGGKRLRKCIGELRRPEEFARVIDGHFDEIASSGIGSAA